MLVCLSLCASVRLNATEGCRSAVRLPWPSAWVRLLAGNSGLTKEPPLLDSCHRTPVLLSPPCLKVSISETSLTISWGFACVPAVSALMPALSGAISEPQLCNLRSRDSVGLWGQCDEEVVKHIIGKNLSDLSHSNSLLDTSPKARELKAKMNYWDLMKIKSFFTTKETIKKTKWQPTEWEKIFANDISDKGRANVQNL